MARGSAGARCPDPTLQCGTPPVTPTQPPTGQSTPRPPATPRVSIAAPSRTPASPSGPPVVLKLPLPDPVSNAEPLRAGVPWTSTRYGFTLQYGTFWAVESQNAAGVVLSAWDGAVKVAIEGFDPTNAPATLIQGKVSDLRDAVLGLTSETDPARQPAGRPIVGFRTGEAALLNGTLNSPQGPTSAAVVAIVAAGNSRVAIRVTIVATENLRDTAFYFSDKLLNAIRWPAEQ